MFNKKENIYVIRVFGEISATDKKVSNVKFKEIIDALHEVETDDRAAGVIMHMNTPGGTTGASEEIATMIQKIRNKGIPVVASIADMCCSGGFWIATACDKIFANKTSLTGSIGVIMMHMDFSNLAEKFGVRQTTIKAGKMKDIGSPFRQMTEEERQYFEDAAKEVHAIFKDEVLKHRKAAMDAVENKTLTVDEIFDGRPFSAVTALDNGLIDEIGTYHDALQYLLDEIGETEDNVEILEISSKKSIVEIIQGFMSNAITNAFSAICETKFN